MSNTDRKDEMRQKQHSHEVKFFVRKWKSFQAIHSYLFGRIKGEVKWGDVQICLDPSDPGRKLWGSGFV